MSGTERESRAGTDLGPYHLIRLIGRGGMGEVYEAEDTVKDRIVALKLLPETLSHDPVLRTRLQREAHSAGRLQEPHVVPIHDYGEIDGLLYVDMRLIDGTNLHTMLTRYGPLTPARTVAIIRQIASALDAAHESGVMHRDVKPENILITRDDFAYLVDFGIANAITDDRLTTMGTAVGTHAYMAPERFTNEEVTYRADIYSLACVLYECLTGSRPYPGDAVNFVITAHLMQAIPRPSRKRPGIPKAFDDVIARGMAKKPEDRYPRAGDLARAAHQALTARDQDQVRGILERGTAALPSETSDADAPSTPTQLETAPPDGPITAPPQPVAAPGPARPVPGAEPEHPPRTAPGPGGAPPWPRPAGMPARAPARRSRTAWILAGIAAFLAAAILGGLATWWLTGRGASPAAQPSTSSRQSPPPTASTATSDQAGASYAQLLQLLPAGTSGCEPVSPPTAGALVTAECATSSIPGGPVAQRYSLFADRDTLNGGFQEAMKEDSALVPCPGSAVRSPTTWHHTATAQQVEGQIACGTYGGGPDVLWTKDSALLLGDAQGPKLDELHQWLLNNG